MSAMKDLEIKTVRRIEDIKLRLLALRQDTIFRGYTTGHRHSGGLKAG